MTPIPNAYKKVPMMFRAQILGRSQLHYIDPQKKKDGDKQDVQYWAEEWIEKAEFIPLTHQDDSQSDTYQTQTYQIRWRFVTNGGQDDGMIRPVIGGYGIPFYPGSSMKGAFRQACEQAEQAGTIPPNRCNLYCGDETNITPGILRFQGAYPINDWTENLVDLVHPQQGWQVKTQNTRGKHLLRGESAYALVSLVQPSLRFGISSSKPLSTEQWQEIWQIWHDAIAAGLGTRVSAGYGQVETDSTSILYQVRVKGQGQAAKLIDGTGEFRPTIFRASLRGHALRLFGGLTNDKTAEALVEQLFGGVQGKGTVGLLKLGFETEELRLGMFGQNGYEQPTYNVEGEMIRSLTRPLPDDQHAALQNLVTDLIWFAMVFGGFGKSWRRADHRLFYPDDEYEKLIGCHWQWAGEIDEETARRIWHPTQVGKFINSVLYRAKTWMKLQGKIPNPNHPANWRESWHPSRIQVWGRLAKNRDECVAIDWLHKPYQKGIVRGETDKSIRRTSVTGELGQIGRLWHRMYPPKRLWIKKEGKLEPISTNRFIELLTLFPDESPEFKQFLAFLQQKPEGFELLWGGKK